MRLTNTDEGYGLVHWLIHWATAVLIAWLFYLGLTMVDLPLSPQKFQDYALHKSLGLTVLALVVARLVWRRLTPPPPLPDGMRRHEAILAKAVHHGIYVLIVLIPLTGWLYSSATASPANYFGYFTVPDLIPANETVGKVLRVVHDVAGKLLLLLLALHIVGAFKHQLVDRDDVLKRMLRPLKD
jgi:cytochrome b561